MGKLNKILANLCLIALVCVLFGNSTQSPAVRSENQYSAVKPAVTVVPAQHSGSSLVVNKLVPLALSENCQFGASFSSSNLVQNTGAVNLFQPSNCMILVDKPVVLSAQVKLQVVNLPAANVVSISVINNAVKVYSQSILPFVPRLPDAAAMAVFFGLVALEIELKNRGKSALPKPGFLLKLTKNIFELEVMRC